MPITDGLWQCAPAACLLIERWDLHSAVYDRRTGETHILSPLPAEILSRLMAGALTEQDLARDIAREHDLTSDEDWRAQLHLGLTQLHSLGLLGPAAP